MNWSTKRKIIAEAHASYVETNAANDRLAEELRQATDDVKTDMSSVLYSQPVASPAASSRFAVQDRAAPDRTVGQGCAAPDRTAGQDRTRPQH